MLSPKKTKYRKQFKGRIHGLAKGGFTLNFGSYGLKSVEPERITARQIEAARRAITRQMKRQGRVWIRIYPDVPVTGKPAEVRMGKGKGSVEFWAARVHPGRIMFEIDGVPDDVARDALRLGIINRVLQHCRRVRAAQTQVDRARAIIDGVDDGGGNIGITPDTSGIQHAQR